MRFYFRLPDYVVEDGEIEPSWEGVARPLETVRDRSVVIAGWYRIRVTFAVDLADPRLWESLTSPFYIEKNSESPRLEGR